MTIPNGRRDDFQDSDMKTDFLRGVEKIVDPLEKKIYKDSERKNSVKPIETAKQTVIKVNKQLEDGFVGDEAKKVAMTALRTEDQRLVELQKKRNVPDTIKEKAEAESEKINALLAGVKGAEPNIDGALINTSFSKKDKETIRKVLDAVHELYDKTNNREELIDRVLKKLKRANL
jgi:hypothetical protein